MTTKTGHIDSLFHPETRRRRIAGMGAGLVVTLLSLIGTILLGVAFWRLFAR